MDCLEAQRIISEALDKVPLDDVSVESAKLHCTGCPECNAFVRTIAATMRAGLPAPSDDLPDRVMQAVRTDIEAQAIARAAATARAPLPAETPAQTTVSLDAARERRGRPNLSDPAVRRSLVAWGSAAAVVLIAAGVFANQGVRQILSPVTTAEMDTRMAGAPADQQALMAPQQQDGAAESAPTSTAPAATAGDYLSVNGVAYQRAGAVPDVDATTLQVVGTTNSSLDTKAGIVRLDILGGQDPSRVYLARPDGTMLAFDRVTRDYQGRQYVLQTGPIESFGAWPTLPAGVGKPSSADGSPVFRELGPDPTTGAVLFEPVAGGPALGIAVGPNSPASDPARGNPDWTWWTPIR